MKHFFAFLLWMSLPAVLMAQTAEKDSTAYKKKTLRSVETDFLFSYYKQDGNNSAVTGGIGTEELTDITSSIVVNIPFDKDSLERTLNVDFGFDAYSSASSDQIDGQANSSASSADTRTHLNATWSNKNTKNFTWSASVYLSTEYDYNSVGFGAGFSKASLDNNREVGVSANVYVDQWQIIRPTELRGLSPDPSSGRNSYSLSWYYSQVATRKLQWSISSDVVYQSGFLSTPFHRVYFGDIAQNFPGDVGTEALPGSRLKLPIGIRANYFMNDLIVLRSYYRYYWDDWDLTAHTVSLEMPIKLSPFFSVYPFYRYYKQSAAKYFAPYDTHISTEEFYTSDYDLSSFDSHFYGGGIRYAPIDGLWKFKNLISKKNRMLHSVELRYGMYNRSNGLDSNIVSVHFKFKNQ